WEVCCCVDDVPGIASDFSELVEPAHDGPAHEFVGHDVLEVVNNNNFAPCFSDNAHDLGSIISDKHISRWNLFTEGLPVLRLEGQGFSYRLNKKGVFGVKVA